MVYFLCVINARWDVLHVISMIVFNTYIRKWYQLSTYQFIRMWPINAEPNIIANLNLKIFILKKKSNFVLLLQFSWSCMNQNIEILCFKLPEILLFIYKKIFVTSHTLVRIWNYILELLSRLEKYINSYNQSSPFFIEILI